MKEAMDKGTTDCAKHGVQELIWFREHTYICSACYYNKKPSGKQMDMKEHRANAIRKIGKALLAITAESDVVAAALLSNAARELGADEEHSQLPMMIRPEGIDATIKDLDRSFKSFIAVLPYSPSKTGAMARGKLRASISQTTSILKVLRKQVNK